MVETSRYLVRFATTGHVLGFVIGETYGEAFGRALDLCVREGFSEQRLLLNLDGPPPLLVKRCGCGLEYDARSWSDLPLAGYQTDDIENLELRNCPCGSTLAVHLEALEWINARGRDVPV
jgi:hypothetical protein